MVLLPDSMAGAGYDSRGSNGTLHQPGEKYAWNGAGIECESFISAGIYAAQPDNERCRSHHKIDSARKAQERWKMLSSSAMDKDGDMSG